MFHRLNIGKIPSVLRTHHDQETGRKGFRAVGQGWIRDWFFPQSIHQRSIVIIIIGISSPFFVVLYEIISHLGGCFWLLLEIPKRLVYRVAVPFELTTIAIGWKFLHRMKETAGRHY
jgi:hypothetical protein